jgi:hypothetical protein
MTKEKEHHVVHNPNGGWDIKKSDGKRSIKHFENKKAAIDFARRVSRDQRSELIIHGKNGRIQRSDSHGNDPCPPKDRK